MRRLLLAMVLAVLWITPAFAESSPRDAVLSAREKLDGLTSYHLSLNDGLEPTDIDFTLPDRVRVTKPESVGLIIGGSTYLNVGNSGWSPAGVNPTLVVLMTMLRADRLISVGPEDTVTDEGADVLGGVAAHKYEIRTAVNGGALLRTVWIGVKDGLPLRVEREGGTSPLTATYSEFNQDFAIEPPPHAEPMTQH